MKIEPIDENNGNVISNSNRPSIDTVSDGADRGLELLSPATDIMPNLHVSAPMRKPIATVLSRWPPSCPIENTFRPSSKLEIRKFSIKTTLYGSPTQEKQQFLLDQRIRKLSPISSRSCTTTISHATETVVEPLDEMPKNMAPIQIGPIENAKPLVQPCPFLNGPCRKSAAGESWMD